MDQLPHLHRILAFKELGLGLTQIAEILDEGVSPEALQGMLRLRQAQLQQQIQAEQEQLVRVEAHLRSLEQGSSLPVYEVVLKAVRPITGVSLHPTTGDLTDQAYWIDIMLNRYGVKPIDHLLVVHTESDDDFRVHIMLGNIQVLLEDDRPNIARDQFIDQGDDFSGATAQPRKLGHNEGIRVGQHFQDFFDAPLLSGFAR
jgi:DNA-binding transcriptional MerR regulator